MTISDDSSSQNTATKDESSKAQEGSTSAFPVVFVLLVLMGVVIISFSD